MDFREKQIPAPKSWETFEDLCHALFKEIWHDPLAQKNARTGQPQHGVDIFGSPDAARASFQGVQCKGKDQAYGGKPTLAELRREINKADSFSPTLQHWIFATSAPVEGSLQQKARELSRTRRAQGRFTVSVLGWEDIQSLLADHAVVLERFYPEHAFDLPKLVKRLHELPSGADVQQLLRHVANAAALRESAPATGVWAPVSFKGARDLGPALLGRSLGPADAAVCPLLAEVDPILSQLQTAYSARLVGEPGAGKSVCAYQAALRLNKAGYAILRLTHPRVNHLRLEPTAGANRTVFLVDDAHLMPASVLRAAEEQATSTMLLLTTHNSLEHDTSYRGSVSIDMKRAVRTIAAALRANPSETLQIVRRCDDRVGESPFHEDLEHRIDHAESSSDRPWQFCFVLGGGWRRAEQTVDSARVAGADVVLSAAAIHQIASQDARVTRPQIRAFLDGVLAGLDAVDAALDWLLAQRLLLAPDDLRWCPSSGALGQVDGFAKGGSGSVSG